VPLKAAAGSQAVEDAAQGRTNVMEAGDAILVEGELLSAWSQKGCQMAIAPARTEKG